MIINVNTRGKNIQLFPTQFYPTLPLTAIVVSETDQQVVIRVFDIAGKMIVEQTKTVVAATNRFTLNLPASLSTGWYYVRFTGQDIDKTIPVFRTN